MCPEKEGSGVHFGPIKTPSQPGAQRNFDGTGEPKTAQSKYPLTIPERAQHKYEEGTQGVGDAAR